MINPLFTIDAQVKSEGNAYNVRLYDQHGLNLPAFVYESRYDGILWHHDTALAKAYVVCDFINSLPPSARVALYNSITN